MTLGHLPKTRLIKAALGTLFTIQQSSFFMQNTSQRAHPFTRSLALLAIFLGSFLTQSCSNGQNYQIFSDGTFKHSNFRTEIPITIKRGVIMMKVDIDGEHYDFIFDSGAPMILSEELYKKLALKKLQTIEGNDAGGNAEDLTLTKLKQFHIGELEFNDYGSAVIDFNRTIAMRCMKADGIFGANAMREGIWEIDYENQTMVFTDQPDSLNIPKESISADFSATNVAGTPYVALNLGEASIDNIMIDLGSNGGFNVPAGLLPAVREAHPDGVFRKVWGAGATGAFGQRMDTVLHHLSYNLKLGNYALPANMVSFETAGETMIGSHFLRNYRVILDWKNRRLTLVSANGDATPNSRSTPGFRPSFDDGKMMVGQLYERSPASEAGLHIDDQILEMNAVDYSALTESDYCNLMTDGTWENMENYDLKIKDRNGSIRWVRLTKRDMFSNTNIQN